jgi:hypothetical protein
MHSVHAGGFHHGGFRGGFHLGFHGGHFVVGVGVGAVVTARFWYPWYRNPVYGYPAYPAYPASVYWYWQDPPGYYPLCHPVSRRVDDGRAARTVAGGGVRPVARGVAGASLRTTGPTGRLCVGSPRPRGILLAATRGRG